MKQVIVVVFYALLVLALLPGCAGSKAQTRQQDAEARVAAVGTTAGNATQASPSPGAAVPVSAVEPVPAAAQPKAETVPSAPAAQAPTVGPEAPVAGTAAVPPRAESGPAVPAAPTQQALKVSPPAAEAASIAAKPEAKPSVPAASEAPASKAGPAAGADAALEDRAYVDEKGRFEIVPTPFGYVKREKKRDSAQGDKDPQPAAQQEAVVPLTPVDKVPASPAEPVPSAPVTPSPGQGHAEAPASVPGPEPSGPAAAALTPAPDTDPTKAPGPSVSPAPAPAPTPAAAVPKVPEKTGHISLDFDDADLYAVVRSMADILKINYIIDPDVSGKVTIHTAGLLRSEDVFPIFFQTLEVNGLSAVKEGNVYRILKAKDASRMPVSSRLVRSEKDLPPGERIILQIIPLKYLAAQEAAKVVTPFVSADGMIIAEGTSNTLLVVDRGINILKVLRMVETFDISVFEKLSYRFYTFQNINTDDAAKLLKEVMSVFPGMGNVRFIPITRLNTLLVVSPGEDLFDRMDAFIRQVDVPSEAAKPQIHIYSVKNGMAEELGGILRAIFGKGGEVRKSAVKDSVSSNPFEKGAAEKPAGAQASPAAAPTPAPAMAPAAESGPSVALRADIRITIDPIRNALIIEAIPADYQVVERILKRLDSLPRQVLIEVVIAEIALGKGTELGIEWTFKKDNWTDSGNLSAVIGASGLQYVLGLSQQWKMALHALAQDSKLNVISSPSVLASDNKQARIDVTTEVPIPSTSFAIQTTGSPILETKVEYRNTGVILEVVPHINEHGLVTMKIIQEVSGVGELLKVADKDYYAFNKRKIETSLTVMHNQSIVIGGLITSKKTDAATGVPWLVKVPILRWLAGKETASESKTELIVMITPRVITSLDDVDAVSDEFKRKIGSASKVMQ